MRCVYCEKAITASTPSINLGGDKMHAGCHVEYMQELDAAQPLEDTCADEPDTSEMDEACGYDYCGYEDYEPNPYDGTYSEM